MHILVGISLALGLLYFWLIGWWFARVILFLGLAPVVGLLIGATVSPSPVRFDSPDFLLPATLGVVLAWLIAALPTYYWRRQLRLALGAPFTPSRLRTLGYAIRKTWRQVIGPDPDNPTPSFWPAEAHAFKPSVREGFIFGLCLGLTPIIVLFIIALGVALGQH